MPTVGRLAPFLALSVLGAAVAQAPGAKPGDVLAKALARATTHNKRVLVAFPGEDGDLASQFKQDRAMSRTFLYELEIVQFAGKAADAMAVELKCPDLVDGEPALLVLAADGKQLAKIPGAEFLAEGEVLGKPLLERLKPLFCAPVDADKKLAAALVDAKKTGRAVFIRFDAPW